MAFRNMFLIFPIKYYLTFHAYFVQNVKVNTCNRTQELIQSDPHQVLNIKEKCRQMQLNSQIKSHHENMPI